jgi:hypothetical protein
MLDYASLLLLLLLLQLQSTCWTTKCTREKERKSADIRLWDDLPAVGYLLTTERVSSHDGGDY